MIDIDAAGLSRHDYVEYAGKLIEGRIPSLPYLEEIHGKIASDRYLFVPEQEKLFLQLVRARRERTPYDRCRAAALDGP